MSVADTAAEASPGQACSPTRSATPRRYGDVKAQRSQAMPSNTLFGSVLERLKPDEEAALKEMDTARLAEMARAYDAPKIRGQLELPLTEAQRQLLQREHGAQLAEWRREFQRQKSNLARTEGRLRELNRHTHYDFDHPLDLLPSGERLRQLQEAKLQQQQQQRWLSRGDIEHAGEMNNVGFKPQGAPLARGYNRDKYADKAPTHRYAMIGDVLRPGMDFGTKGRHEGAAAMEDEGTLMRALRRAPKTMERQDRIRQMPPKTHIIQGSQLELPVNIKHQFGSKLCENVLADPQKVEAAKPHTAAESRASGQVPASARKGTAAGQATPASPPRRQSPNYDALSGMLRSNIFPGLTCDHTRSTTHRSHHPDVYNRRDDVVDKFRFQWDHVSRWSEANVMHSRLLKELDAKAAAK